MRNSVLTRASVRLSVIPKDIMNKLKGKTNVSFLCQCLNTQRNADPFFVLQEPEDYNAVSFKRLALINKPEWKHGAVGVFASAALGLQMPGDIYFLTDCFFVGQEQQSELPIHVSHAGFALALAGIIGVFYEPTADAIRSGGLKWAGIYVAIGIGCWLAGTIQVTGCISSDDLLDLFSCELV